MTQSSTLERFTAGDIDGAVDAALASVRAAPGDIPKRLELCELLTAQGSLERADKQLDLICTQDPSTAPGVSLFRQILRAAEIRAQFHREGRVPEVIEEPDNCIRRTLEAAALLRVGEKEAAQAKIEEAEGARPKVAGTCDDVRFPDFRDADDMTAPFFEVFAPNGKFFIIPHARVRSITFQPIKTIRDMIYRPAEISVDGGLSGFVYLPTIYAGTETERSQLRLGRATEWTETVPARAMGQRLFLVGDEAKPISAIGRIEFDGGAGNAS